MGDNTTLLSGLVSSITLKTKRLLRFLVTGGKSLGSNKIDLNEDQFEYSAKWYDNAYHIGRVGIHEKEFKTINLQYERAGYRNRLETVINKINIPSSKITWLEVGCHLGLTAYWIGNILPSAYFYMLDFSNESIKWCQKNFPFNERATIWQANVDNIFFNEDRLANKFDYASCIDVTEHLPEPVYRGMIRELFRVIKPGGFLILMQGNTPRVEHIHVLKEEELISDFESIGFVLSKKLPERHYLLQKPNKT
ncbi:MAG: class I SAM-dependent methyltransferase [Chloroflexi bacterium]|nr:MAG: class I SAM-dependent methyltransferase [Chloroflexota bacterium]